MSPAFVNVFFETRLSALAGAKDERDRSPSVASPQAPFLSKSCVHRAGWEIDWGTILANVERAAGEY